jgi:hypothetical protein
VASLHWLPCGAGLALPLACDLGPTAGSQACDPFAYDEQPTGVYELIAAGRADDATVYVADGVDEGRVFVSEGEVLRRQQVAAISGGGGIGFGLHHSFDVAEHDPPFTLKISEVGDTTRIGVVLGEIVDDFEIGEEGEELALLDAEDLEDFEVRNLPATGVVEYLGDVEDGRIVVVTRPENYADYSEFRVFLGAGTLHEHALVGVARELDGGTTTIEFEIEGGIGVVKFPTHEPAWLDVGGQVLGVDVGPDVPPDGVDYRCLAR